MQSSEEIKAELEIIRKNLENVDLELAPLKSLKEKIKHEQDALYQDYINKVALIKAAALDLDNKMFDGQKKVNADQQRARQLEAQLAELKQAEDAQAKAEALQLSFLTLQDNWNKLTMGAPWREWAKDHQITAGHAITGDRKVILADPMGLGKTLSAIISLDMAEAATRNASPEFPFLGVEKEVYVTSYYDDNGFMIPGHYETKIVDSVIKPCGRKVLYFCPSPMIKNVEKEFRIWTKHRNVLFIGGMSKAERQFALSLLADRAEFTVICNYEAWRKDLSLIDSLIDIDFDTVIIDEAHNIKDPKSIAYRGIKRLLDTMQPPYVIPMTGTPILNRPQELFSLLTLVDPNRFYHLNSFLLDYCEQDEVGFYKFKPGGLDRVAKAIGKHFLRRTKDQAGIELPDQTITEHLLILDPEAYPNQAKVRDQMRKHAMIMLDENKAIAAAAMIAVYTRLRQIETWPAGIKIKDPLTKEITLSVDVEESQKVDYIINYNNETGEWDGLIPEVIEDERIVVFSQFKAPLHELKDRIERMGKRAIVFDGDANALLKEQIMVDFDARYTSDRSKSKWDVVLANYRVGGAGVNLTAASQVIVLDEEWSSGKRDQAYGRVHRMGQEKPVTIHVIRDQNTVDDWIAGIIEAKENLVSGFESTMEGLSAADFKDALESGLI